MSSPGPRPPGRRSRRRRSRPPRARPNRSPASAQVDDPRAVLVPELVAGRSQPRPSRRGHCTAPAIDTPPVLIRDPDSQVVEAVAVEVARGERRPEAVAASATLDDPGLSWCQSWLPAAVRPRGRAVDHIAPRRIALRPDVLVGAPTARSAKPSPLKSPAVRAEPKKSPASAESAIPGMFWCQNWLPAAVGRQPRRRSRSPPRRHHSAPSFRRGPPRQVVEAVVVEVAGGEGGRTVVSSAKYVIPGLSWCQYWLPVGGQPPAVP